MKTLSRAEQETIVLWDAESQTAIIDTAMPSLIRKLDRLAAQYPNTYRCIFTDDVFNAKRFSVPAQFIRFGKPTSKTRRETSQRTIREARDCLQS